MASISSSASSSHGARKEMIWSDGRKYIFCDRTREKIECDLTIESVAEGLVREYDFDAEKMQHFVSNLIAVLGKTDWGEVDLNKANQTFQKLVDQGLITIEQVGFRKQNKSGGANGARAPKFYLMINTLLGKGGNNQFHVGFSRKGTLRAVLRDHKGQGGAPALAKELSKKEFVPECFSRRSLRIMNEDPRRGITILELGGENLRRFPIEKLPREKRWQLYLSIFQGLNQIHKLGVHLDVKPENLVVDEEGCAKFIDFDTMRKQGRAIGIEKNGQICPALTGTLLYYSPKLLAAFMENRPFVADKKDDIWAGMLTICELESRVPENDRMLSPELIERFKQYHAFRVEIAKKFAKDSCRDVALFDAQFAAGPWKHNLFHGIHGTLDSWPYPHLIDAILECEQYPLNPLIYAMAATRSPDRVDAATALFSFADPKIQSKIPQRVPLPISDMSKFSRVKRYRFYIDLLEQLHQIHQKGEALQRFTPNSIFIDGAQRIHLSPSSEENPLFSSPELANPDSPNSQNNLQKGDIWSAMMFICHLETQIPGYDRLLSDRFIEQFSRYRSRLLSQLNPQDMTDFFGERLFEKISPDEDSYRYPLDRLVGLMAKRTPERRCSSRRMVQEFGSVSLEFIEQRRTFRSRLFGPKN